MALPPLLTPAIAAGLAQGEEDDVIKLMASAIHSSFKVATFAGAGTNTAPPAAGPIVSTLM